MVKPVLPVIEYYADYDYIATILCENKDKSYLECNGKCYLEKQMKKADTSHEGHEHNTLPSINLTDYPISTINWFNYKFTNAELASLENNFSVVNINQQTYPSLIFKPPIA